MSKNWNRGIIEILSIQCPEQLKGIEFIEVAPYLIKDNYLAQVAEEAFVESLIWRNPKAFSKDGKNTLKIINENVIRRKSGHHQLLNAFLSVAPTPNRFVRDKATKGLVCLLQNRIHLIPKLLEKFKDINDFYITERLFAVAYGCALRNQKDKENLKVLAEWIYKNVFENNKPPVHIILRDYARGAIEVTLNMGIILKINEVNINPPYKNTWPKRIPSENELKKKYYPEDFFKYKTKDRGFLDIWSSVMSFGDFARYVIGTNTNMCEWSGIKFGQKIVDRKVLFENFIDKLNLHQKQFWGKCDPIIYEDPKDGSKMISGIDFAFKVAVRRKKDDEVKSALETFKRSLNIKNRKLFKKDISPYLDHNLNLTYNPAKNFDLRIAQRWIFNRVVELGYDLKLHGEFDDMVKRHDNSGRSEHKSERIGKNISGLLTMNS